MKNIKYFFVTVALFTFFILVCWGVVGLIKHFGIHGYLFIVAAVLFFFIFQDVKMSYEESEKDNK